MIAKILVQRFNEFKEKYDVIGDVRSKKLILNLKINYRNISLKWY